MNFQLSSELCLQLENIHLSLFVHILYKLSVSLDACIWGINLIYKYYV